MYILLCPIQPSGQPQLSRRLHFINVCLCSSTLCGGLMLLVIYIKAIRCFLLKSHFRWKRELLPLFYFTICVPMGRFISTSGFVTPTGGDRNDFFFFLGNLCLSSHGKMRFDQKFFLEECPYLRFSEVTRTSYKLKIFLATTVAKLKFCQPAVGEWRFWVGFHRWFSNGSAFLILM